MYVLKVLTCWWSYVVHFLLQDRKMLSTAQQMVQDSRTKIELLRMQIVKVSQVKDGERDSVYGKYLTTHMGYVLLVLAF